MFPTYYELKDDNKLPLTGRFSDPYDSSEYRPIQGENLDSFIERISKSRKEKNIPEFFAHEVRMLVVMHLAETCSKNELRSFFEQKALTPDFSQIVSLTKTLVNQRYQLKSADYKTRQDRAASCSGCRLNKTSVSFNQTVSDTVKKMAGLSELIQSDLEKSLGMCGACGCNLRDKVTFDIQAVLAALAPEQLRAILLIYGPKSFEQCWMLRECLKDSTLHKILEKKVAFSGDRTKSMLAAFKADKLAKAKLNGA